jgi:hypothetical protein
MGVLSELLAPLFSPVAGFTSAEQIDAWQEPVFLRHNLISVVQNFLAFGVGALLLRGNPLLPGSILYFALAAVSVRILHGIAIVADPSVTYSGILSNNPVGWIAGFLAAFSGMLVGHGFAQRRSAGSDAP